MSDDLPTAKFQFPDPGMGEASVKNEHAMAPGTLIGNYKILSILGEGGCGIVYLAERERPIRGRVALKVIKPGMDSRQVIARFEAERQALALMDHPNVARVLDGGVSEQGRPYFVMEYVKGIPITEHCDRQKLSISERLELFMEVCAAVQHAHQKGIIHRDLKPSNILVSIHGDHAIPKVIDFGVAKAMLQPLTERTLYTEQGQLIGTPEYMSPEQAEMTNQDVDTRTDIYSLGVVLYELLTGFLPFEKEYLRTGGFDHIRRVIREEDPPTPSTRITAMGGERITQLTQARHANLRELKRELKGDLDWITLRAMDKDRTRRYETANGLAADVRRYLANEPVVARPPSAFYRLQKTVRRNKITFAAVTAVAVALIVVTAVTLRERANTARQRDLAQDQRNLARQAVDKMFTQVAEQWLSQKASLEPLQEQFLQEALDFYTKLAQEEASDPDLRLEMGNAYRRIGRIQFKTGKSKEAEAAFHKANAILEPLVEAHPQAARFREAMARNHHEHAFMLRFSDRTHEAHAAYQRAYDQWQTLVDQFPDAPEYRRDMALSLGGMADTSDQSSDSVEVYRRSLEIADSLPAEVWHEGRHRLDLGLLNSELAYVLKYSGGDTEEYWRFFDKGQAIYQQLVDEFPTNPAYRNELAYAHLQAGGWRQQGTLEAAESSIRKAIDIEATLVAESPSVPDYQFVLGQCYQELGHVYHDAKRLPDAESAFGRSVEILGALFKRHPDDSPYHKSVFVFAIDDFAFLRYDQSTNDDKKPIFTEALAKLRNVVGGQRPADVHFFLGNVLCRRAGELAMKADFDVAAQLYKEGIKHLLESGGHDDYTNWNWFQGAILAAYLDDAAQYHQVIDGMTKLFGDKGEPYIAERVVKSCLLRPDARYDAAVVKRLEGMFGADEVNANFLPWFRLTHGIASYRAGRYAEAIDWFEQSKTSAAGNQRIVTVALFFQAMAQHELGRPDDAKASYAEAQRHMEEHIPTPGDRELDSGWHDVLVCHIAQREAEGLFGTTNGESPTTTSPGNQ